MDLPTALALVAATLALVAIPGPNVTLIVANTLTHGTRHGVASVAGTTLGVALQVALLALGLAALMQVAAGLFEWLRWLGAGYLVWLGVTEWRRGPGRLEAVAPQRLRPLALLGQGMAVAVINPKTLLFNAAFLPQFAGPQGDGLIPVALLYLAVVSAGDLLWVLAARSARGWLARAGDLRHRLSGALYMFAGAGLALAKLPR